MTKEEIMELGLDEIEERANAIALETAEADKEQLETLNAELDAIEERRATLKAEAEKRAAAAAAVASGEGKTIEEVHEYLEKEKLEDQNKMIRQNCSEICTLFEVNLGRSLSPVEVKIISDNSKFYKKSDFENAIFEISKENDVTVNQCIDYLKKGKTKERKVDKENEKAILDFFESINKKS